MFKKYPALFLLISIIGGVVSADLLHLPGWVYLLPIVGCGLAVIWVRKTANRLLLILLIFLTLLFSFSLYYNLCYINLGPNHITRVAERSQTYQIFGYLSDWPRIKYDRTEIKLSIDSLRVGNQSQKVSGNIMIKLTDTTTILQRGDRLEFFARIYPVVSSGKAVGFDYQRFLNHKNIFGIVYLPTLLDVRIDKTNRYSIFAQVDRLREYINNCFKKTLSKNSAALAGGFLIGDTRDIPVEIYQAFRQSGTLHLLAVSGSNVALVLLFAVLLLRPLNLNRKRRSLVLLLIIFIFALLSYNEPSVLRASVMAALIIGGSLLERRVDLNHIIAVAAVVILIAEPSQLYDVGFQLSFVIAWALIFVLPKIVIYFDKYKNRLWYRWLVFPFLISLIAQIFSTGIIALYFSKVPLISPLANLIVVPLVSLAVVGEMVLLVGYTILPQLGQLLGSLLEFVFIAVKETVAFFGQNSMPAISFANLSVGVTLLYYLILVMATFALVKRSLRRVLLFSLLILVNVSLGYAVVNKIYEPSNRIYLTNLPGGIGAVVQQQQTDLVVTSLISRDYHIDEKILEPFLKQHQIKKLSRVFILGGDFHSYDDLIRLSERFKADSIIVWPGMEHAFADAVNSQEHKIISKLVVAPVGAFQSETEADGYFCSRSGLLLESKGNSFYFTDEYQFNDQPKPDANLVLGRLWNIDYGQLKQLAETQSGKIYCAKIEQTLDENISKTEKLDYNLPNVVDLYDYQEVNISF